jgi:phospholipid transport system substrate-binding protein
VRGWARNQAGPDAAGAALRASDPEAFIKSLGDRALAALNAKDASQDERVRRLEDLLGEATDLDLVGRLALGRYWPQATAAQRSEYPKLFRDYARAGPAGRLRDYGGGIRSQVTGSRPAGEGDTVVSTEVSRDDGQAPVHVDWRVRKLGGRYAIVDVAAEGVSMLVTSRSQLESVAGQRDAAGLLDEPRSGRRADS